MIKKNKAVLGIYRTRAEVEQAVEALKVDGFDTADISVLLPDSAGAQSLGHVKGTKAPEGDVAGGGTGAIVGGTLGLLAGIGVLAVTGVGALIAAGPIMAAMAGAGVGGTIGGLGGALIGLGMPEYEAKRYEGFIKDGGLLLSVHTDSAEQIVKAKKCLENTGAEDISATGEVKGDWKTFPNQRKEKMDSISPTSKIY